MKRTRADPSQSKRPSSKTHKRPKNPNPKQQSKTLKPIEAPSSSDASTAHNKHQEEHPVAGELDFGESFGFWCGSIEEDLLLGWFPWTGALMEEEEEGEERDFDIWQLQQINEIPNGSKGYKFSLSSLAGVVVVRMRWDLFGDLFCGHEVRLSGAVNVLRLMCYNLLGGQKVAAAR
ncbi:uncharacterized protein A4U43_C01F30080 [Asparagus officinalis]|uniref:Uncharacterized protein n=1 Tax=Asparagus officinalis TaxID=4686 RepID=A0A5P1FWZ7_ASPOF|nr:uncharacterized protein A4U43_C01F30080 [Asparagus officinalis]